MNIYEKHNLHKLEKTMAGRSARSSVRKISSRLEVCSLQDNLSTVSTEISSGEGKETEASSLSREDREGKYLTQPTFSNLIEEEKNGSPKKKKISLKIMKPSGSNVFVDDDVHSPNRRV